jgi:hypothetical protein
MFSGSRGVSDQFVTDVQFARTEAASRQEVVGITFKPPAAANTCYIVHTCGSSTAANCKCDCNAAAGSRCPDPALVADPPREIKTVQHADTKVRLVPVLNNGNPVNPLAPSPTSITFDPATGAMTAYYPTGVVVGPRPIGGAFWSRVGSTTVGSTVIVRTSSHIGSPHHLQASRQFHQGSLDIMLKSALRLPARRLQHGLSLVE